MTNYIERYWRDATPADAIREPPMVARFRDEHYQDWVVDKLIYWDRSEVPWHRDDGFCYFCCQVYDAPDPGDGWRLIDVDKETPKEDDHYLCPISNVWCFCNEWLRRVSYSKDSVVRRRIEQPKTEPKYVPFTWEDREQLRGRWITWKHENGLMTESQINHINQHRDGGVWFKSHDAKWLLENATFLDTGEPVGKRVQ